MTSSRNQSEAHFELLQHTAATIPTVSAVWHERALCHLNRLTKPLGSLGRLEEIAARLVQIYETEQPGCERKAIYTLAADHGVADEGVSAYPKAVTGQMVLNFLAGGAAINVLARHGGIDVVVVDIGVDADFSSVPGLLNRKVATGTSNMAVGPAMSEAQTHSALVVGIELAQSAAEQGCKLIGTGEMGIGNTTAASAISAVLTGRPVDEVTGSGTGLDGEKRKHKVEVIERALRINQPDASNPVDVLRRVGGLEIAGLTGLILGAASRRIPVVIDGFISGSAAAIAVAVQPRVHDFLFAAHRSAEPGHAALLQFIGQQPLLDLGMRLGEGTGAALAMNIIDASARLLNEMATFSSAGVSEAT